ncbi:MAG: hypothetical protein ACI9LY_001059 [Arenicella sp.]
MAQHSFCKQVTVIHAYRSFLVPLRPYWWLAKALSAVYFKNQLASWKLNETTTSLSWRCATVADYIGSQAAAPILTAMAYAKSVTMMMAIW